MHKTFRTIWQSFARIVGVLALLVASAGTAAQGNQLQFSHLLKNEGIATGAVEAVYQDSYGYIWFGGTAGSGLVQYNGYDFTLYKHQDNDPNSLSNNVVWNIFEDSQRQLWVATDMGINRFNRETRTWSHFVPDDPRVDGGFSRAIVEDMDGNLWVGFMNGGLGHFNRETGEFQMYVHEPDKPDTLSSRNIRSMHAGTDGNVWIGTEGGGLNRFDISTKTVEQYWPEESGVDGIAGHTVLGVHQTDDGIVWAGTDNGLSRLNPMTGQIKNFRMDASDPKSIGSNVVGPIVEDFKGNFWIGTEGGLHYLNRATHKFDIYRADPSRTRSLDHNAVRSLHLDTNGGLWIGSFPSGLSYLDQSSTFFSTYKHNPHDENSLSQESVLSIQQDAEGRLLLGTDGGGLNIFNRDKRTFTHHLNDPLDPETLSANGVLTIAPASNNKWWLGTWDGGLNLFDPKTETFKHYRASEPGPADHVWAVLEDSRGSLWVGTVGAGLGRYDRESERFIRYTPDPQDEESFPSQVVWSLHEDHLGNIWIGSNDGLARYLPETDGFRTYVNEPELSSSLSADVVYEITQDEQQRLWLATRGGGLNRYHWETDSFSHIRHNDGLPSDTVMSVVPDAMGNIWMGTANGISRFTPENGQVLNYSQKNGLQGNEFNIGAGHQLRSGELAFGGIQGFTLFHPQNFEVREPAPRVEIVGLEIFNQPVEVGAENSPLHKAITHTDAITLNHKQSVFSLSYVALSYSDPARNEYAYRLEGFEKEWNHVDNRRIATYTNLDAGTYVFRVKAANSQGVWNTEGDRIKVQILPPLWQTWWAYSLYALIIAGIIFAFVKAQLRKVKSQRAIRQELECKVAERTEALQQKNVLLEAAYKRLEEISLSDPLTKLANRRYLQKFLPKDIAEIQRKAGLQEELQQTPGEPGWEITFLLLDMDNFKQVNDKYGHAAGDRLLVQFSGLLANISRKSDFLVRWGGEEFLIVSRYTHRDEAPQTAERIRRAVAEHPFTLEDGRVLHKTCSIGYASFPFLPRDPQALSWERVIDTADQALYAAKNCGRNRCLGLYATPKTPRENLYAQISDNLQGMIERGELQLIKDTDKPAIF